MPLPKPKPNEAEKDFINRCMSADIMQEDYPDEKQRVAVCYSQWKKRKDMREVDYRSFPLEMREEDNGHFVGHAAIFDSWSQDLGGFREIVRPGAFTKTLNEADVRATFNHDPNYVLGRNKSGTLTLSEDKKGLAVDIDPPDTTWAKDLRVSMGRGDINQMSFAFRTIKDNWWTEDEESKRELLELSLDNGDVSIVTYPAYEKTRISARTIQALEDFRKETEEPPEEHSSEADPQAARALAMKRRRLELAEKL